MPRLTTAERLSQELHDYLNNPSINRVIMSVSDRSIGIVFRNGKKVNLHFDLSCRFERLFLTNGELEEISLNGLWFENKESDRTVLAFVYNVINRKSGSVIFQCEYAINELWNDG